MKRKMEIGKFQELQQKELIEIEGGNKDKSPLEVTMSFLKKLLGL